MNAMKLIVGAAVSAFAVCSAEANGKSEFVAEGFPAWSGVTEKNFYGGRMISTSDLRHRAVIVIEVDPNDEKLTETLMAVATLARIDPLSTSHAIQWQTAELPRHTLVLLSLRGKRSDDSDLHVKESMSGKALSEEVRKTLMPFRAQSMAIYYNVELDGETRLNADGKYPFVYVMGPDSAAPLWSGVYSVADSAKVRSAYNKAKASVNKNWKPMTGVEEVKYFPQVLKTINAGKAVYPAYPPLKQGIKAKDPEKAKEAQIVYDALEQYRSDLMLRIVLELSSAPARAYMDADTLFRCYPKEKKKLAAVQARMKANKELSQLGKIFTSFMKWSNPDYTAKKSEYKKNIQEINKWKKILTKLETAQNAAISGEAALINSQLDMLIDMLNSKMETEDK